LLLSGKTFFCPVNHGDTAFFIGANAHFFLNISKANEPI